jgi:hypothetical protein
MLKTASSTARRYITEQQLDEAVEQVKQKTKVTKEDLQRIGQSVAHDPEVFACTDIDDINTVLDALKKK